MLQDEHILIFGMHMHVKCSMFSVVNCAIFHHVRIISIVIIMFRIIFGVYLKHPFYLDYNSTYTKMRFCIFLKLSKNLLNSKGPNIFSAGVFMEYQDLEHLDSTWSATR
jgi:hypothetical protein